MFKLIEELKKYTPFDENEKLSVQKTLEFLINNDNCYSRTNLAGHVTGSAFVVDMAGNILLNHHKIIDMWFQFGGHCDGETDCISVAKRELEEESGLDDCNLYQKTIYDVDWHIIPSNPKKNEPEHYHYDITFLFITSKKNFKISNESADIKWVTTNEAYNLIDPTDISTRRMIMKYEDILKK